jgi:hypothetical protein
MNVALNYGTKNRVLVNCISSTHNIMKTYIKIRNNKQNKKNIYIYMCDNVYNVTNQKLVYSYPLITFFIYNIFISSYLPLSW